MSPRAEKQMGPLWGYEKPHRTESRKFFTCDYWGCTCGYGEHAGPSEFGQPGGRIPACPHCERQMRKYERHWHKKG